MPKKPVAALLYDFDKTLSPKNMQEYAFIPEIGLDAAEFWKRCEDAASRHRMDRILAYMMVMVQEAEGKMLLTRGVFSALGRSVALFPGVDSWFSRVNAYADSLGLKAEHYILSSGLREIIEGTPIAAEFRRIYAAGFCYNEKNVPVWPAMAVNYTSKTQFLFRINKGVEDMLEHDALNEFAPEDSRPVPFRNMIYFGDGPTDVPCMKLVREKGGHSVVVYQSGSRETADRMLRDGRADYALQADYREGKTLEQTVFAVLRHIAAADETVALHRRHLHRASGEDAT